MGNTKKQTAMSILRDNIKRKINEIKSNNGIICTIERNAYWGMLNMIEGDSLGKPLLEQEKEQLYDAWDKAIEAHDKRGHNISRSSCDVDDYYEETYNIDTDAK